MVFYSNSKQRSSDRPGASQKDTIAPGYKLQSEADLREWRRQSLKNWGADAERRQKKFDNKGRKASPESSFSHSHTFVHSPGTNKGPARLFPLLSGTSAKGSCVGPQITENGGATISSGNKYNPSKPPEMPYNRVSAYKRPAAARPGGSPRRKGGLMLKANAKWARRDRINRRTFTSGIKNKVNQLKKT